MNTSSCTTLAGGRRTCVECGRDLDENDPGCPACLLQLGFTSGASGDPRIPPAGRRLGRYELLEEIGKGGMGVVFRARQADLGREVAVKILAGGLFASRSDIERFHTEAAVLARLTHPGIVTVYEVGVSDGQAFLAMELLPGGSLAEQVRERPMEPCRAAEHLLRLTDAVQFAHLAGVWHRDLKPGNVLLDASGRPRLTDFGIARLAETGSILTSTGQTLGTPGYLAPEQVDETLYPVGPLSDLYALGALLYHLLTSRPPFSAANVRDAFRQTLEKEPVAPTALNAMVPADLEVICLRCLAKEPCRRYPDAGALAEDLRRFLSGRPILARPDGAAARLRRWRRRHPGLAALSAAFATTVVVALITVGSLWRRAESESARAIQSLWLLQRDRAADLLSAGRRSPALVQFAELLRRNPEDRLAAARAASTLMWEPFPLPEAVFRGHTAAIRSLAADSSGGFAVTGSQDGTARVWNLRRPDLPPLVLSHAAPVLATAFSGDARLVLSASEDGVARLWSRDEGALVGEFAHGGPLSAAGLGPDGQRIFTAGKDGTVRIWTRTGNARPVICDAGSEILVLARDPRERWLAVGCRDGVVQMFGTATGAPHGPRLPHEQRVLGLAFSGDGRRLATASRDGHVRVWDTSNGVLAAVSPRLSSWVTAVAFSPDGQKLALGGAGRETLLWQPDGDPDILQQWSEDLAVNALAFSPDGDAVLSASEDGQVNIRRSADGTPVATPLRHGNPVTTATFLPRGGQVLTGDRTGTLTRWNTSVTAGESLRLFHPGLVFAEWSREARHVLTAGDDRVVRVWDSDSGQCRFTSDPLGNNLVFATLSPDGTHALVGDRDGGNHLWQIHGRVHRKLAPRHRKGMWRGLFSPDSRYAVTLSWDGEARAWSVADGREIMSPLRHDGPLACADFDAAGRRLAIGTRNGSVRLWAWPSGAPIGGPLSQQGEILSIDFSPDGTQLLSTSQDGTARRWDVATGQLLGETVHESGVTHGKFRPDGRTFVIAGRNRTAQLWSTATGKPAGPPLVHPGAVIQLAFDPSGDRLATVTDHGTVHLWDPASGFPVGEPPRSSGALGSVGFSPDGSRLLIAGDDGMVKVWPVPNMPLPVPDWFPDLLEFVAAPTPNPEQLARLRQIIHSGDPHAPWNAWARSRLEPAGP